MRKILSPAKGHGETIHIDAGDGEALCGWSYLAKETFDGHPIYRGSVVTRVFTCSRCKYKLIERLDAWSHAATREQLEDVAVQFSLVP